MRCRVRATLRFEAEREQIAMEKARFLGEWHDLLKMVEEALYAAQRSGITSRIVAAARMVAWAAWFCNDDARAHGRPADAGGLR